MCQNRPATGAKSASCKQKRKQKVTAQQKLCSENKAGFKKPRGLHVA